MKPVVQIATALVGLLAVYVSVLWLIGRPAVVTPIATQRRVRPKEKTMIVKGYAPSARMANMQFNTTNPLDQENFRKIARSVNTQGGAQFTYSFWIKLESTNDALFKDRVLLIKGDARKYKTATYDPQNNALLSQKPADHVVACPLIAFGDGYRHVRLMFNTTAHPQTRVDVKMNASSDAALARRNVLSLLPLKWHLLTFTFEDGVSKITGHENGIRVQMWLDDFLVQENSANDTPMLRNAALRQNDGPLFLLPDAPAEKWLLMGDVMYHNYALDAGEIASRFRAGPPTEPMEVAPGAGNQAPPYLSAFNKIEVYNR